jgi:hypothetical protein
MHQNIIPAKPHHLTFVADHSDEKVKRWAVADRTGAVLGWVRWISKAQKFCYFPGQATVYPSDWLIQIADFLKEKTPERA